MGARWNRFGAVSFAFAAACIGYGGIVFPASASEPTTYYVSPGGDDDNPGLSVAQPFRTVQRCASVARAGDTCAIRGGTYRETVRPAQSGTIDRPITFTAYGGEAVTISGADAVRDWVQVTPADVPINLAGGAYAAAVAEGRIYKSMIDLNDALFDNQVFIDGKMMNQARWPNTGLDQLTPVRSIAGPGSTSTVVNDAAQDFPAGFWAGATIWINGGVGWRAQTGTVLTSVPGQLTYRSPFVDWQPYHCQYFCSKPGSPYYLTGVLGALDVATEWHYDDATSSLYVWTPDGAHPSTHLVEAKQRDYAFDLRDRSYIHVSGLRIFSSSITTAEPNDFTSVSTAVGNVLDGLEVRYVSHFVKIPTTDIPLVPSNPLIAHELDTGIILAGEDNVLRNSVITHSAGNGVSVRGTNNTVDNNLISDVNYAVIFNAPILVTHLEDVTTVYGTRSHLRAPASTEATITRNTVYNAARDGILYTGYNKNFVVTGSHQQPRKPVIAYNNVFNTGLLSPDSGGIYVGGEFPMTGSNLHHNWFHDNLAKSDRYNVGGYLGVGVYLDLGQRDVLLHHNVMWNNGAAGLLMNPRPTTPKENRGLLAYNNTFADGQEHSYTGLPATQPGTRLTNNIFRGPVRAPEGAVYSSNLTQDVDPLFVDAQHGDFRVGSASPAIDAGERIIGITDGFIGIAPDIGAYESGGTEWTPGCTFAACAAALADAEPGNVSYSDGWNHCFTGCDPPVRSPNKQRTWGLNAKPYAGTLSSSSVPGSTATATFSGPSIAVHVKRSGDTGIAAVSVDGGPEVLVDTYQPTGECGPEQTANLTACLPTPPGAGDQLVFQVRDLPAGVHTVTIRTTGDKNAASAGSTIHLDRLTVPGGTLVTQ